MITGEANQVGPTPMEGRRDALCAAAEMILKVNQLPDRMGGNMVATVGHGHGGSYSKYPQFAQRHPGQSPFYRRYPLLG